jgi:hypothetical protein
MASSAQSAITGVQLKIAGRNGLVDRYFYFAMSLLFAAIVVWGFSQTVNQNLFHPPLPRPVLLWIHAAAFSAWVVFYIFQSGLVRTHNVKWHRFFGWFGVALGVAMVVLGFTISIIMGHFDVVVLHQPDPAFLAIPFSDMLFFGTLFALAIYSRRKPEFHRRLMFLATCVLMDAAFGRFLYIFNHSLFHLCLDAVMLLGVARDLVVNRSVHKVYRIAIPLLCAAQLVVLYLWRGGPAWWLGTTKAILGL